MWKRILKTFGVLYVPLLVLSLFLFITQKKDHIQRFSQLQERETIIKKELFVDLFGAPIRNINYWSQLEYPTNFATRDVQNEFMEPYVEIIKGITEYDQFRFLDLNGQEFFRAERKGVDSLAFGALQDKHTREYFKKGIGLKYGEIYLSPINLNRENGTIEKPYKPVIRAVGPIFNGDRKKIGVVVINFKMERILNHLRSNIVDNNFYLLDQDLNIITSNTTEYHIPFEVSDSVVPLQEMYGLSKQIFKKDTTFLKDDHIWSVQNLNLNESKEAPSFGIGPELKISTPSRWTVVQELPPKFLKESMMLLYFGIAIFNVFAILLLLAVSYYLVKGRLQKEVCFQEVESKNTLLSENGIQLKKKNAQISKINQRLEIRNKQLSEFNYLVSHNLKAPVTSMAVIVDMIKKEKSQVKINELLPKLSEVAGSITELTKDIGEYVSILDQKKIVITDVDVENLVERAKKIFSETLLDSKDFQVTTDFNAWKQVQFSEFYLQTIFQNLISNAIKYSREDVSSYIHFETGFEDHRQVLYVKDNGIGINLEKHGENIFKLYKRFHRNISGKGIGLFLVKSQLEALHATITVESKENRGTTFKINF